MKGTIQTTMTIGEFQYIFSILAKAPLSEEGSLCDWKIAVDVLEALAKEHEKNAEETNEKISDLHKKGAVIEKGGEATGDDNTKALDKVRKEIEKVDEEFKKKAKVEHTVDIEKSTAVIMNEFLSAHLIYSTAHDCPDTDKLTYHSRNVFYKFMLQLAPAVEEFIKMSQPDYSKPPVTSENTAKPL